MRNPDKLYLVVPHNPCQEDPVARPMLCACSCLTLSAGKSLASTAHDNKIRNLSRLTH